MKSFKNKTHKNTYVIIYGDYNYYFEKIKNSRK